MQQKITAYFRLLATVWLAFSSMPSSAALAQSYGELLTRTQVYALSVQGFSLGMTTAQANEILKKDGWEGKWYSPDEPNFEYPFSKGISKLYLQKYPASDKQYRLWSIVDKQAFDRPRYDNMPMNRAIGSIWINTVIAQFGAASMEFSNPNGINAYVYYHIDRIRGDLPKLEVYLNGYEATYELTDRSVLKR